MRLLKSYQSILICVRLDFITHQQMNKSLRLGSQYLFKFWLQNKFSLLISNVWIREVL